MPDLLICPNCKDRLIRNDNRLACRACGAEYGFENGIFNFLIEDPRYRDDLTPPDMEDFLDTARVKGWKTAVRSQNLKLPGFDEYVMSTVRTDWLFHCVDFPRTRTCLDIGSGWGAISFALSSYFGEVWSLEPVQQRIDFQRIRQEQENITNINLVRSDWIELPFRDNCFDVICANGVLDLIGLSDYSKNPKDLQKQFLNEARRILKPGGCLYIGTKNRFNFGYFLGSRDSSGMRFTSLLPRKIADLVIRNSTRANKYRQSNRIREWPDYRTCTYSLWGYRNLLRTVDFSEIDFYWTTSYNNPRFAGKMEDDSVAYFIKYLRSHKGIAGRFASFGISAVALLPRKVMKFLTSLFVPDFLIFCYKHQKETTFENKLVTLDDPISAFFRLSGSHSLESKVNYFLFNQRKPGTVLKFSRSRKAPTLALEEERMSYFNGLAVQNKIVDSVPVFVEPAIQGDQILLSNHSHNLTALKWLLDFQKKTEKGTWDQNLLESKIFTLIDFLSETEIEPELQKRVGVRIEEFSKSLRSVKLPVTAEHGDFCNTNIIINKEKCYVVDWEFFEEYGDPLSDFIFFFITSCYSKTSPNFAIKNLKCEGKYSPTLLSLISIFSKAHNITPQVLIQGIPFVLVKRMYRIHHSEGRHISNDYLYYLLNEWDKINDEAAACIISRLKNQNSI